MSERRRAPDGSLPLEHGTGHRAAHNLSPAAVAARARYDRLGYGGPTEPRPRRGGVRRGRAAIADEPVRSLRRFAPPAASARPGLRRTPWRARQRAPAGRIRPGRRPFDGSFDAERPERRERGGRAGEEAATGSRRSPRALPIRTRSWTRSPGSWRSPTATRWAAGVVVFRDAIESSLTHGPAGGSTTTRVHAPWGFRAGRRRPAGAAVQGELDILVLGGMARLASQIRRARLEDRLGGHTPDRPARSSPGCRRARAVVFLTGVGRAGRTPAGMRGRTRRDEGRQPRVRQ
jgi:hypothetical protein